MGGFLQDKATEMLSEVMKEHGIEPGELLDRISRTLDLIESLKPVAEDMAETSDNLERDVAQLRSQMKEFNSNSEEMVDAMNGLSETLGKFHGFFEDIEEEY